MSDAVATVGGVAGASAGSTADAPRFLRRLLRSWVARLCLAYLAVVLLVGIAAPILLPDVASQQAGDLEQVRQGPSSEHLLGTDTLGRDVADRLLVGTRVTIVAVVEAVAVSLVIGVPLGLIAGYLGGRVDRLIGWFTDLSFAIPDLIIILVVLSVFSHNTLAAMVTLGALFAPRTTRMVRAATLSVREELYISAARVSGLSRPYIVTRHVMPRVAGVVIIQASLFAAAVVVAQAGLSFLGVLGDPPAPSWGEMIADGISVLQLQPWLIWPPGIAIGLTVLAFTLLGDAVRDVMAQAWTTPTARRRASSRSTPIALAAQDGDRGSSLLSVRDLSVTFDVSGREIRVVDGVSFDVRKGEAVGIVGESGCGKTMTAMAILGLLPGSGRIESGSISYDGRDLTTLSEAALRQVRGKEIALVSQEPMASLTPTLRVGWQVAEAIRRHHGVSKREAGKRAVELLAQVRLPEPEVVARRYLHELSGGMAQRIAIARALAGDPKLLIADEPTTALDVTIQMEVLDLLRSLQREREMGILLITHDWGVMADLCDRAAVMYAGEVVEQAPLRPMFRAPLHPYTEALLASNPHHAPEGDRLATIPGSVPSPGAWPQGCHFHPRCRYATDSCQTAAIPMEHPESDRQTRCIHHEQVAGVR